MDSEQVVKRHHAVFLNFPMISQIKPMLELAKFLHSDGFYITFIITDSIHQRILKSTSGEALQGMTRFRFETIADGLSSDTAMSSNAVDLIPRIKHTFAAPFSKLLEKLNSSTDSPPVTCIICDILMTFAKDVAEVFGIPLFVFWTASAAYLMGSLHVPELIKRGYTPLKDESYLTNGYLDAPIDWIPGMKNIRLRSLSAFIRTTKRDDMLLNNLLDEVGQALRATGVIFNTFDHLEADVLHALPQFIPRIYTIGPLGTLVKSMEENPKNLSLTIYKQDTKDCKLWLDAQKDASVVYISFGSLKTLTEEQLAEFAWGFAASNHPFLWIFRNDLVKGGISALPREFIEKTKGRSLLCSWCNQEQVLAHPAIGAFLTHAGWNSMTESICAGVPLICWPLSVDQFTNSHYACNEFGVGVEINEEVKREQVQEIVREVLGSEKQQELRRNAMKWKELAKEACIEGGSSYKNLKKFVSDLII